MTDELCGAPHPEPGHGPCILDLGNHRQHVNSDDEGWDNEVFQDRQHRHQTGGDRRAIRAAAEMGLRDKAKALEERSGAGVLLDDPAARERGIQQAYAGMEPEFREAIREGAIALTSWGRWCADDLWDWLEINGHHTEHPKGMSGMLRTLVAEKVMQPVPEDDPEAFARPRRTNKSRMLRRYEARGS